MDIRHDGRDQGIKDSDRLNKLLPLKLKPQDVDGNSGFVKLLSRLTRQINAQGVGAQTHKDLVQAQEVLKHEKLSWLLQHILHLELQELVLDYEIKAQETSLASDDKHFMEIMRQCLTYAEISDYLDFSPQPTSKVQLLGLSKEDIHGHSPYKRGDNYFEHESTTENCGFMTPVIYRQITSKYTSQNFSEPKHVPSLQQKLIPEIEDRLKKKCENLVTFYQPSKPTDSTRLALSKAVQLPVEIETSKHQLSEEQKQLQLFRQERDKQFWLYYQTLLDMLSVLEKLLKEYKLDWQVETDLVNSEWLIARCDAMCLKIRMVELEILCDTYTADTVQALDTVRKHLDSSTEDHEKDLVRVDQALQAYEAVGMGFDKLVEEYSELKGEMENKQWALAELQQTSTGATG